MMKAGFVLYIFLSHLIQVKADSKPKEDTTPTYYFLGCFNDLRHEWVFFWWLNEFKQNAGGCATQCSAERFQYFGMAGKFGTDCHCGNGGYDKYGISTECTRCEHKGEQFTCGAKDGDQRLVAVYEIAGVNIRRRNFIGCWGRSNNVQGVLGNSVETAPGSPHNTSSCSRHCKVYGYLYSGLTTKGSHCYCGSDLQWEGGLKAEKTNKCFDKKDGKKDDTTISVYRAVCKDKEYGENCLACNCQEDKPCDETSGVCPGSCAHGWTTSYSGGPCSEEEKYGIFVTFKNPCEVRSSWHQPVLNKIKDGDTSTCVELSHITNDTWWMAWRLEEPIRIQEITVQFHEVTTCAENVPVIAVIPLNSIRYKNCNDGVCIEGLNLYPKKLSEINQCSYRPIEHSAVYTDTLTLRVPPKVVLCEVLFS